MTREQFIAEWRHVIMGVMCENVERGREGATLALWLRTAYPKIDAVLGKAFDAAHEKDRKPDPQPRPGGSK